MEIGSKVMVECVVAGVYGEKLMLETVKLEPPNQRGSVFSLHESQVTPVEEPVVDSDTDEEEDET